MALFANPIPVPVQTVSGKLAGFVTEPNVDMPDVSPNIVDTMRDQFPVCPAWEVMAKRLQRRRSVVLPLRYRRPRHSLALVSMEKTGLPSFSYCAVSSPMRSNCSWRSSECPPAISLLICRSPKLVSRYHALTVLRSIGVPLAAALSANWVGVWLVKTASGSPGVCKSNESIRLFSSRLSESILFFGRHRGDERVQPQDLRQAGQTRECHDRRCFSKYRANEQRRSRLRGQVAELPRQQTAADPFRTKSQSKLCNAARPLRRFDLRMEMPSVTPGNKGKEVLSSIDNLPDLQKLVTY